MRNPFIVFVLLYYLSSCGYSALDLEREGNDFFHNQNYEEAITKYTEALIEDLVYLNPGLTEEFATTLYRITKKQPMILSLQHI